MKLCVSFLSLLIPTFLSAQDVSFKIDKTYVNPYGENSDVGGFIPLLKLESDSIFYRKVGGKIKRFPKKIDRSDLAYGFVYFTGIEGSFFKKAITLLVANYSTRNPMVYVDKNGNLDFTDDGEPELLDTKLTLRIPNSKDKLANFHYQISKSTIKKKNENPVKLRYASMYPKSNITSPLYWLFWKRLSVRFSKAKIDQKPITILINDSTVDGLFTFQTSHDGDRILIIDKEIEKTMDLTSYIRQGEPIDHNATFELYGKRYRIKNIAANGDYLTLKETNRNTSVFFKEGTNVKGFEIELLDKKTIKIADFLKDNTHLLIDVGGTWCAGCIAQEPTIKQLYKQKKVEVIGVFGRDTEKKVSKYVKKHHLEWPVALMSQEFKNLFKISAYPTYILISPKGEIVLMDFNSEKVVQYLNKKS